MEGYKPGVEDCRKDKYRRRCRLSLFCVLVTGKHEFSSLRLAFVFFLPFVILAMLCELSLFVYVGRGVEVVVRNCSLFLTSSQQLTTLTK